jgi:hypothetical protein
VPAKYLVGRDGGRDDRTSRRGASSVLRRELMLENGSLAPTFSNGHRLTILDLFKEYELYHITRPGQTIVV